MGRYIKDHEDEIEEIRQLKRLKSNQVKKINQRMRGNGEQLAQQTVD